MSPRINGILEEEWASISKDYAALRQADPRIEAIEAWSVPMLRLDDAGVTDVCLCDPFGPSRRSIGTGKLPQRQRPVAKGEAPRAG